MSRLLGDARPAWLKTALDPTGSSSPRIATLLLTSVVAAFLLYGWDALLPHVLVPLLVGGAVGLSSEWRFEALVISLGAACISGLGAVAVYASQTTLLSLRHAFEGGWAVLLVLAAVVLMPASALGARLLCERSNPSRGRDILAWAIAGALAVSFLFTVWAPTQSWLAKARVEPAAGSYHNDQMLNLKTYYLMQDGQGFYPAYVRATGDDGRRIYGVVDGKFITGSSAMMRQPAVFYLWKVVAPQRDFGNVAYLAAVLAAAILLASYWALSAVAGYRALFVAPVIFPALVMLSAGVNTLFPEYWALLALLAGFFLAVKRHLVWAGVFGLIALLLRETFGAWLLALILAAAILAVKDRRCWRYVGLYVGLMGAGIAGFMAHVAAGNRYVVRPAAGFLATYLLASTARPLSERFILPISYMMFPYGLTVFSPAWLVPLGLAGLWVGLRGSPVARLASFGYLAFFLCYMVFFGAPAIYWGQAAMPLLLVGVALLLASLDSVGRRASWRLAQDA